MSRTEAGESPVPTDDDSISLASTAPSEPKDEYLIEGIMAERVADGATWYLVKWEGYPDERCTWEPESSFQDEQTFHDWQNQKMRISRGLDPPCNVGMLEMRVENWIEATEKRKARRKAKRIRLGLIVDSETEGNDSDCASNNALDDDNSDLDTPLKKRRRSSTTTSRGTDSPRSGLPASSRSISRSKPNRKWTAKEENALRAGLEIVKGPFWDQILDLFGPTGSKSQDLKDKDSLDLEAKTLKLKTEFLKCGRDFPPYLRYIGNKLEDRIFGKIGSTDPMDEDIGTSSTEDSLMEEMQQATVKRAFQPIAKPSESRSGANQSKPLEQRPKVLNRRRTGPEDVQNRSTAPKPKVSTAQMIPRVEPAKKAGPARNDSQMGTVGRGPLRLGQGTWKLKSASKKPKVSGAAVLANWDTSVKPRRKQLPLQNATSTIDKPSERFGKLSTKRRYEKASRTERAPNIASLTLRDPKEFLKKPSVLSPAIQEAAKTNKSPSIVSPTTKEVTKTTKTPFELYQESLGRGGKEPTLAKIDISTSTSGNVETSSLSLDEGEQNILFNDQTARNTVPALSPRTKTPSSVYSNVPSRSVETRHMEKQPPIPFREYNHQDSSYPPFLARETAMSVVQPTADDSRPLGSATYNSFDEFQVIATIHLGPERLSLGVVRFRGLDFAGKRLLLNIKTAPRDLFVWFNKIVVAEDYKAYFPIGQGGYSGYIAPFPQTEGNIKLMAETLKMTVSGGLFLGTEFSMLVYPSASQDWAFLDGKLPAYPPESALRFVMRGPLPELMQEQSSKLLLGSVGEEYTDVETMLSAISIKDGESSMNAVLRIMYDVDYSRLAAPSTLGKTTDTQTFFLIFPPSKGAERDLVVQFLQHNNASEILVHDTKGAWEYFATMIDAGVIIIHEDFFDLWRIPNLARVLRKPINVWNFNMTASPLAPDPHLNRLFPHGAALLLTDGLFLHRPREAARILTWFRLTVLTSKAPRTWKLCTRPCLMDWLLKLQADRNMEDGKVYVQCYGEVWRMVKDEYIDEGVPGDEQSTEDAPIHFMGSVSAFDENVGNGVATNAEVDTEAIARNDRILIEWFAGYAMTKLEYFRRFDIVTGIPPNDERQREIRKVQAKWSHVDIMTAEELYLKLKVPGWNQLDKEEERRVKSLKKKWAEEDAVDAKVERFRELQAVEDGMDMIQ